MKSTAKKGIRIWFCVVNGKDASRYFRRHDARTFARTFNYVSKGRAKCRIECRAFINDPASE